MAIVGIEFGIPSHGWIEVRLSSEKKEVKLDVSDVPCDSLRGLVAALSRIIQGSTQEIVEWSLEPDYAEWLFVRAGDELQLTVTIPNHSTPKFSVRGNYRKVIYSLLKSLCDLQANPVWESPAAMETVWSWEFPSTQLIALKEQFNTLGSPDTVIESE